MEPPPCGAPTHWPVGRPKAGAIAFSRHGSPDLGEFDDAVILKTFGDVPDDFRFVK
jgi:hypothetical protein